MFWGMWYYIVRGCGELSQFNRIRHFLKIAVIRHPMLRRFLAIQAIRCIKITIFYCLMLWKFLAIQANVIDECIEDYYILLSDAVKIPRNPSEFDWLYWRSLPDFVYFTWLINSSKDIYVVFYKYIFVLNILYVIESKIKIKYTLLIAAIRLLS